MTVSSQVNRKDYAGNGSTTAFATEFRFLEDTELNVILTLDSTGAETPQDLTTNYTVTGVGDDSGGTVTMIVPPATGETLTIIRDMSFTQQTDYVENDDFPAESHERALDKLTMIVQQQQEEIDRSLKLSEGQKSSGLTIPAPDTGKFLQWDSLGNFINVDIANQGLLVVTAFGQSLISAIDAIAGRLVMGSAKKISTAVTDNLVSFDSDDEAKDSGIAAADVTQVINKKSLTTDNLMHVQDQKASGTDGGNFTGAVWLTRDLNTVATNTITGASLSTNQITLPAGDYYVTASAPAFSVNSHKIKIRNITDVSDIIIGSSEFSFLSDQITTISVLSGVFTLASTKVIELQHRSNATQNINGLGEMSAMSVVEVYANIEIWKV